MPHSYEEIRSIALDILAGREQVEYDPSQFEHLRIGVAEVIDRREGQNQGGGHRHTLDGDDSETFLEVFWDLFRQGIITLGLDNANREFPWFRVSRLGTRIMEGESPYFFHDVSSYEQIIKTEIPNINSITLLYLKEAMQSFQSGCILSSSVMLGVATEHTFLLLLGKIESNTTNKATYANVFSEWSILRKINKFKNILEQNLATIPQDIKEDLDTNFASILSVIKNFRNESGHPSGRIISREQAFVLLHLFIPYCKKMYQLLDYFS